MKTLDDVLGELNKPEQVQIFKDQLFLVLLKRLGGRVVIPATEVDDTGDVWGKMDVKNDEFILTLEKKQ